MVGRPKRRVTRSASKSRREFFTARDRALSVATTLDEVRPGAGDEFLDQLTASLVHAQDQLLSGFPLSATRRN